MFKHAEFKVNHGEVLLYFHLLRYAEICAKGFTFLGATLAQLVYQDGSAILGVLFWEC